jgi:uncharacterized protein YbaR (Trm112 family)
MSYLYNFKEKEPILVCSDQDMSYSIKENEPTLVCSDQDMSYSIKEKEPTLLCSDQGSDQTSVGSFSFLLYDIY